jgi:hypothetical protein
MKNPTLIWIVKLAVFVILVQTLYFKFTATHESIYIFSTLGIDLTDELVRVLLN